MKRKTQTVTAIARRLRKRSTEPERRLWSALRARRLDFKFRRQVPLCGYVVDFACFERRVVVELDGSQHGAEAAVAADAVRDARLRAAGFCVVRFRNVQVYRDLPTVLAQIYAACGSAEPPSPCPSPSEGEGTPANASR
jgi:very-short-patch-repair endonuclease